MTERKTSEEVEGQYHGMDWLDTVRCCSAVTRSCNM